MAVRPFYINAVIDGRKTDLAGGTRKSDGTHHISIYQRDEGAKTTPFTIEQYTEDHDGVRKCITRVYYLGDLLKEHITNY